MIPGLHLANLSIAANLKGAAGERSMIPVIDSAHKAGNTATLSELDSVGVDKLDVPSRASSAGRTSALSVEFSIRTKALTEAMALLQTVDAALVAIDNKLGDMAELAEEAAKQEHSRYDRALLNVAFQELKGDVNEVVDSTTFNGEKILKGGDGSDGAFTAEFGAGENAFTVVVPRVTLADLSVGLVTADISTLEGAVAALDNLQEAETNLDNGRESIARQMEAIATEQFLIGLAAVAEQTAAAGREVLDQPDAALEFSKRIAQDVTAQAGVFLSKAAAEGVQQLLTGLNVTDRDNSANGVAETSDLEPDAPGPSLESTP